MFLTDSHCHLDKLDYKKQHYDLNDVIFKALDKKVKFILAVSTTVKNFYFLKKFIKDKKNIFFSCGIHPLYVNKHYDYEELYKASKDTCITAFGETGLDYNSIYSEYTKQQESFRNHIRLAIMFKKPIIVHSRNAFKDVILILKQEQAQDCGGILHCFTETKEVASKLLDLGFYISFSGIITFHNAKKLHEVINYIPLDRILIETDSPYLAPEPYRGKENQPAYLFYIADYIAKIKKINVNILANITTKNFFNLFKLQLGEFIN